MYGGRTSFRVVPWIRILIILIASGSIAAASYCYSKEGLTWLCAFYMGFSILGVAGIIESFSMCITLDDREIRYRASFGKTVIPKSDIVRVTWEAGSGVSLLLSDGAWARLPDLGQNSQGLASSIRSWLRAT